MAAARCAKALQIVNGDKEIKATTKNYATETFGVKDSSVERALTVLNFDDQDLITKVDSGEYSVKLAASLIKAKGLKPEERSELIEKGPKAINNRLKELKQAEKNEKLHAAFAAKARNTSNGKNRDSSQEDLTTIVYPVVYFDPLNWNDLEAIGGQGIYLAENCAVFIWCPLDKNAAAIDMLNSWGCNCTMTYVWTKKDTAELLLFGTKGSVPAPKKTMPDLHTKASGKKLYIENISDMFPGSNKYDVYGTGKDGTNGWDFGNAILDEKVIPITRRPGGTKATNKNTNETTIIPSE